MAVPSRKTVQSRATRCRGGVIGSWSLGLVFLVFPATLFGQFIDPLDAYPPRWSLDENDCDARMTEQGHANDAGAEGGRCETVTMLTAHGTKAVLVYPIEPVRPIDALTATISVKGLARGIRIGFRVRFPYLIDPLTKRPASLLVYGSAYERIGEFQRLGVSDIDRDLKLKRVALRNQFGPRADVSSPYVDAVVINAYGGPGNHTLRLDLLKIDAMVPLFDEHPPAPERSDVMQTQKPTLADASTREPAFAVGRVTRILQHNGEPLAWVRSLGFDSVWLSEPPTGAILNEAIAARMKIYAPPPSSPDERLAPLLEPVAAWIVGSDRVMDSANESAHADDVKRLRRLPSRWQRPLIGCPVESLREYAAMLDGIVLDAPPRVRNLSSGETKAQRHGQLLRINGKPMAVAVAGMANPIAGSQSDAIASRIGASPRDTFRWHGMWRQVADAMGDAPEAILIRSTESLSNGSPLQQSRAMSLSFVNRFVAALEPWIGPGTADPVGEWVYESDSQVPLYFAHRLRVGPTTLLILTTTIGSGEAAIAGDGKSIAMRLPPADQGKLIWRLTHFSAERITPETASSGTKISVVSPDVVEVIAISDEVSEGGKLGTSARRFAPQAALDRWQLASESILRSENYWHQATAARVVSRAAPQDLLNVARTSLETAEQLVRSGQAEASLRMSRRADAWCAKSDWMLRDALLEGVHFSVGDTIEGRSGADGSQRSARRHVSSPPLIAGDMQTQIAWTPLLKTPVQRLETFAPSVANQMGTRSRWGVNRIAGGDFERSVMATGDDVLQREGWSLGRRHVAWAESDATLVHRGAFSGNGALRLRVAPRGSDPLPGGYEGTCLIVRTPPVLIQEPGVVRIDAMVRTLGFSDPHQGVLVYDSIGTQEMGLLVRDQPEWTPLTLIRQVDAGMSVGVMMEVIGGGEAVIDDIQVRMWETTPDPSAVMQPISRVIP